MVHRKNEIDLRPYVTTWKAYVNKNIFCQTANTLVESQTQQVLQFLEFALDLETDYNEIEGISKETLDISGVYL